MRPQYLVPIVVASIFSLGCAELIPSRIEGPPEEESFQWEEANEAVVQAEPAAGFEYELDVVDPKDHKNDKADRLNPARFEDEVIEWVNVVRAEGADCGEYGVMRPVSAMEHDGRLGAAAKRHSDDMAKHDRMAHEGSDGTRFWNRTQASGYAGTPRGENVAVGYPTPEEVVRAWVESDGHCLVLMLPETNEMGVGYKFRDETRHGHFWTMVTGVD